MRIESRIILLALMLVLGFTKSWSGRAFSRVKMFSSSASPTSGALPPAGLMAHLNTMMLQGLELWEGSEEAKIDAASCLSEHLLRDYERKSVVLGESRSNKDLFEKAKHLHKACKARAQFMSKELALHQTIVSTGAWNPQLSCIVEKLTDGTLEVDNLYKDYDSYLARNQAVFHSISGRHEGIKVEEDLYSEDSSLKDYAEAASKMGAKVWVQEANEWMWSFALSFFRRNGAKKDYLRNASPSQFDLLERTLLKDLMLAPGGDGSTAPEKIRLLDVGSCYNPIRNSPNAPAFDCTAIDLHPAHHSVKKADFLSDELVLPGGSFDVVSMSLVLSYLPHHSMRRQMIRKARHLLISPPTNTITPSPTHLNIGDVQPDAHRAGLLLIAEKASIFKSRSAAEGTNRSDSLVEEWKEAISQEGFRLVKYRRMRSSDGRHSHLFAFRTIEMSAPIQRAVPVEAGGNRGADVGEGDVSRELWIRQDFAGNGTAEVNTTDIGTPGERSPPSSSFSSSSAVEEEEGVANRMESKKRSIIRQSRAIIPPAHSMQPLVTVLDRSLVPPVAIVGAGLGGAALALSLQRAGIPVAVFEKDADFSTRRQGYALTMQQGSSVLDGALGISMETLLQPGTGVSSLTHKSMDKRGHKLGLYGATPDAAKRATSERAARRENKRRHNVHIPRQKLRELLLQSLEEAQAQTEAGVGAGPSARAEKVVRWGKELVDFDYGSSQITVPLQQQQQQQEEEEEGIDIDTGATGAEDRDRGRDRDREISLTWPVVDLHFSDGSLFQASVVVGADGIYSRVRALMESKQHQQHQQHQQQPAMAGVEAEVHSSSSGDPAGGLDYLGIMVVLGISPLATLEVQGGDEDYSRRQNQWLDGTTRVFSMPFGDGHNVMWQLSFPLPEEDALALSSVGAVGAGAGTRLKAEALRRCEGWHAPLVALLQATDENDISGHPVYDRECASLHPPRGTGNDDSDGYLVVLGDAAHPMSPFKGQGANQALLDAVSLAKELKRSMVAFGDTVAVSRRHAKPDEDEDEDEGEEGGLVVQLSRGQTVPRAVASFEEEMIARASEKVRRSREAARLLHGGQALHKADTTRASAAAAAAEEEEEEEEPHKGT